jgi:hypothetical protein
MRAAIPVETAKAKRRTERPGFSKKASSRQAAGAATNVCFV